MAISPEYIVDGSVLSIQTDIAGRIRVPEHTHLAWLRRELEPDRSLWNLEPKPGKTEPQTVTRPPQTAFRYEDAVGFATGSVDTETLQDARHLDRL